MKRILILSYIPVEREAKDNIFRTLALWARDINVNSIFMRIDLICPVRNKTITSPQSVVVSDSIAVHNAEEVNSDRLCELVRAVDIVQVPGNLSWRRSALGRQLVKTARRYNKVVVVGISSNRARTTIINSKDDALIKRARSLLRSVSITLSQKWLVKHADGVHIIGEGLRSLLDGSARSIHVGVASWISASDIRPPREGQGSPVNLVIASRLEKMKGVAIGIDAVMQVSQKWSDLKLSILGIGPESENLKKEVAHKNLESVTTFEGQVDYPKKFFERLREADYVLLTNLNDEQPRLIFDAISQGAIPICPKHVAYESLGLHSAVMYDQGDSRSLSNVLLALMNMKTAEKQQLHESLRMIAINHTIEDMHRRRAEWIAYLQA